MANQVLVCGRKYEGKYVALRSFDDNTVLACGKKPAVVMRKASKDAGSDVADPVLVFVPTAAVNSVY
jgi:ribosomal protein L14E/L6E/L27E